MAVQAELGQPVLFLMAGHMQLPHCKYHDISANCMAVALHLGDYSSRTVPQQEQRLTQAEEQAVRRRD
ncbi:hypothetical protein ABBQ38_012047 [Trebouxia sp. C0009 RCD-2024]